MVRARWESIGDARDAQRPPRRYYQMTGAGAQALRDATEQYPGLTRTLAPGAAPAAT
jgi:DNA-binding PadR family transcriptional regulator